MLDVTGVSVHGGVWCKQFIQLRCDWSELCECGAKE